MMSSINEFLNTIFSRGRERDRERDREESIEKERRERGFLSIRFDNFSFFFAQDEGQKTRLHVSPRRLKSATKRHMYIRI